MPSGLGGLGGDSGASRACSNRSSISSGVLASAAVKQCRIELGKREKALVIHDGSVDFVIIHYYLL